MAAFRQYFVKTGLISPGLSEIYGQVMEDRQEGDYELLNAISKEDAEIDLQQTQDFVDIVEAWLKEKGWL